MTSALVKTGDPVIEDDSNRKPVRLGPSIRDARTRAGLSQRELARRLSLSAGMISQLEKGHTQPSVTTLLAVARVLGVSLDSLFNEDDAVEEGGPTQLPPSGTHLQAFGATEGIPRRPPEPAPKIEELIAREGSRSTIRMGAGVTWELLTPNQNHPLLFMLVTYPVGSKTNVDGEFVRHTDFEYFYVLHGTLDVYLEFEHSTVGAGESMWFDSTRPHNFENNGDVDVKGVWCLLPQE